MSQKRNRSINWDEVEKQLLRSVLKDYAQVIENKSLDTNTSKQKTKAWEEVHKKFNQLNSRTRDLSQLKVQWKGMKVNARKILSTFKKEMHKTGGGARPESPDVSIIEVKDLLNPAELLRDQNQFDSDGIVIAELECPVPNKIYLTKQENQDKQLTTNLNQELDTNITNVNSQQLANMYMESIEDIDVQVHSLEFQDNAKASTSMEKMDTLPVKNCEDDIMVTPIRSTYTIPSKKVPKRNIIMGNNSKNSNKDKNDYLSSILSHSKMLKDKEHMKNMKLAEEKHAIEMEIYKEKLKCAVLEREILELRKASLV